VATSGSASRERRGPVSIDGRAVGAYTVVSAAKGSVVAAGGPRATGCAPTSGCAAASTSRPVLGSRSRDVMAGLGPAAAVGGRRAGCRRRDGGVPGGRRAPAASARRRGSCCRWCAGRVTSGFRTWDTLRAPPSGPPRRRPTGSGCGLEGGPVEHRDEETQLPSEGGLPRCGGRCRRAASRWCFLADHPVTGGYPVVRGGGRRRRGPGPRRCAPVKRLRFRWGLTGVRAARKSRASRAKSAVASRRESPRASRSACDFLRGVEG